MSKRFRSTISAFLPEDADPNAGGGGAPDAAAQAAADKAAADAATAQAAHDALPQWARDAITNTNRENAAARIKLKAAEADAAELKALRDEKLTETERNTKAATDATERADKAELRALVLEVAHEKGLSTSQSKRLQGKTRAELEADADDLLANFPATPPKDGAPLRRKPSENLRGGSTPSDDAEETDPAKLAARIPRRY